MMKIFKFEMLQRLMLPQEFSQGGEPSVQGVVIRRSEIAGREPEYVLQYISVVTVCEDGSLPPHTATLFESALYVSQPSDDVPPPKSVARKRR